MDLILIQDNYILMIKGSLNSYFQNFAILFLFLKSSFWYGFYMKNENEKFLFYLKYKENMCGSSFASQFTPPKLSQLFPDICRREKQARFCGTFLFLPYFSISSHWFGNREGLVAATWSPSGVSTRDWLTDERFLFFQSRMEAHFAVLIQKWQTT